MHYYEPVESLRRKWNRDISYLFNFLTAKVAFEMRLLCEFTQIKKKWHSTYKAQCLFAPKHLRIHHLFIITFEFGSHLHFHVYMYSESVMIPA